MSAPPEINTGTFSCTHDVLEQFVDGFVAGLLAEKSVETAGTYRRALNEFKRWNARHAAGRIVFSSEMIAAYKYYLMHERMLRDVSISTYLTSVRKLCDYLIGMGYMHENPAALVRGNPRPTQHARSILNQVEVSALLGFPVSEQKLLKRDRAIVHMMLLTGLSEVEIVRADMRDLVLRQTDWFLHVQGKGRKSKDAHIFVPNQVMDALRLYLDQRGRYREEDPLFVSHGNRSEGKRLATRTLRMRVRAYMNLADVKRPGVTPHSLSHTAPLLWLEAGVTVAEVQRRLRHGTLETTLIHFKKMGLLAASGAELSRLVAKEPHRLPEDHPRLAPQSDGKDVNTT